MLKRTSRKSTSIKTKCSKTAAVLLCLVVAFSCFLSFILPEITDIGFQAEAAELTVDLASNLPWQILEDGKYSSTSVGNLYNNYNRPTLTAEAPNSLVGQFAQDGADGDGVGFMYYLDLGVVPAGTYTVTANAAATQPEYQGNDLQTSTTKLFIYSGNNLTASSSITASGNFGNGNAATRTCTTTADGNSHLYVGIAMNGERYDFELKSISVTGETSENTGSGDSGSGNTGSGDSGSGSGAGASGGTQVTNVPAPQAASKSYLPSVSSDTITQTASGHDLNFGFENNDDNNDNKGWTYGSGASRASSNTNLTNIKPAGGYPTNYSHNISGTGSYVLKQTPQGNVTVTTQTITGLNPNYKYLIGFDAKSIGLGVSTFTACAPGAVPTEKETFHINSNLGTFGNGITGTNEQNRQTDVQGWHDCYVIATPSADGELVLSFTSQLGGHDDYKNHDVYGSYYTLFVDNVTMQSYLEPTAESLDIPIKLYDYSFRDLETAKFFEFTWYNGSSSHQAGVYSGLLEGVLDENGRPVFTDRVSKYNTNTGDDPINANPSDAKTITADLLNETVQMFRTDAINSSITLYREEENEGDNEGYFVFDSSRNRNNTECATDTANGGYFPLCDSDTDAEGLRHNYHFGMEMQAQFLVAADSNEKFTFQGDDDFWLFIDDVLILDIGGVHTKINGTIDLGSSDVNIYDTNNTYVNNQSMYRIAEQNLNLVYGEGDSRVQEKLDEMFGADADADSNPKLAPGYHDLTIYYMERNTRDSNLTLITNLSFADVVVEKEAAKLDPATNTTVSDIIVGQGDIIRYRVKVVNPSLLQADNIAISDIAPEGVSFIADTLSCYVLNSDNTRQPVNQPSLIISPPELSGTVTIPGDSTMYIEFDAVVETETGASGRIDSITNTVIVNDQPADSDTLYTNPLEIQKNIVDEKAFYTVGETIIYKITIKNASSEPLTDILVDDSLLPLGGAWLPGSNGYIATLAPGASRELSFQYTVAESDLAAGKVDNTATASIVYNGQTVTKQDTESAEVEANNPQLEINKTVSLTASHSGSAENAAANPGDTLYYYITVSNTGDALISDIQITDDHDVVYDGTLYPAGTVIYTIAELPAGTSANVIGPLEYVVPVNSPAASSEVNTAEASGSHNGSIITVTDTATHTVMANPQISAVKEVSTTANGTYSSEITAEKGSTVYYRFTISNTGNTVMTVRLEDVMDPESITALNWVNAALSSFTVAPGETRVFDNLPVLFPENINVDTAVNTLNTYATYIDPVTSAETEYVQYPIISSATVNLTDPAVPGIKVEKSITAINGSVNDADIPVVNPGDAITYTIVVTNTGNCTLDVSLKDIFNGTDITASLPAADSSFTLTSGSSKTVTVILNAANDAANADVISNIAEATGVVPGSSISVTGQDDANAVVRNENIVPAIDIKKSVSKTTAHAGETVTYTIIVKNTGNCALSNVTVTDSKVFDPNVDASTVSGWTATTGTAGVYTIGTLSAGSQKTISYDYVIPAGATAGESFLNTAVASGTTPGGSTVEDTDNETVTVGQVADILVTKTVSNNAPEPNEDIYFTVTVTNNGSTTLTGVEVVSDVFRAGGILVENPDTWQSILEQLPATLTPGQTWTSAEMHYTVPADAATGTRYVNTVTVTSNETGIRSDDASATVGDDIYSQVTISKLPVKNSILPGQTADFMIVVSNNSNAVINDLVVYDIADVIGVQLNLTETAPWYVGDLAPGEIWTTTVSVPTEANQPSGVITNTAYLDNDNNFDPTDNSSYLSSDDAEVTIQNDPKLSISKNANVSEIFPGGTIVYDIVVKNIGNCTLENVTVEDIISGEWRVSGENTYNADVTGDYPIIPSLPVGAEVKFTFTHTASGSATVGSSIHNEATADSTTPGVVPVTDDEDVKIVAAPEAPVADYTIVKHASSNTAANGDTVSFWITVTNTGNVPIYNVTLTDVFTKNTVVETTDWQLGCPDTLQPGEYWTSPLLRYTVSDALGGDIYRNRVSVNANQTKDDDSTALPEKSSEVTVTVENEPKLDIIKTADRYTVNPGQKITYSILVKNTGNCALANVTVSEVLTGGTWKVPGINTYNVVLTGTNPVIPALPVGGQVILNYEYTVPANAAADSVIENVVTATSTTPGTDPVSDDENVAVIPAPEQLQPSFRVTKHVTTSAAKPGDTVYFWITVTNTGNVALTDVELSDSFRMTADGTVWNSLSTAGWDLSCPAALAVGDSWVSAPMAYTVPDNAESGGHYDNLVTVNASYSNGSSVVELAPQNANAFFDVTDDPALSIIKTANVSSAKPGDMVVYTIVVENKGNCDLENVAVSESISGGTWAYDAATVYRVTMTDGAPVIAVLPRDGQISFTYTCRVPEDAAAESIIKNIATASCTTDNGPLSVSDDADITVDEIPVIPAPSFTVSKNVSADEAKPGETVYFWISVTNTGNQPLYNVTLTDEFIRTLGEQSNEIPTSAWTLNCPETLPIGGYWNSQPLSYTVPANADGGEIFKNTVAVSADYMNGDQPTALPEQSDDAEFVVKETGSINVVKEVTPAQQIVGGQVEYIITVENTGNTVLTDVVVNDPMLDKEWTLEKLEPGETSIYTQTYTIPENHDIAEEPAIVNTVYVTALSEGEVPVEGTDTAIVVPMEEPETGSISITKEVVGSAERVPGDVVVYTILVTNNSDIDYRNLKVTDELLDKEWTISRLDAGDSYIIPVTESTMILPSDTPAGELVNVAELFDSDNNPLDEDDAVINVLEKPEITVIKAANVETAKPGDSVVYTILVSNTGNTVLENVVIEDKITGGEWTLPETAPEGFGEIEVNEDGTVSIAEILPGLQQPLQLEYTCTVPATAKSGEDIVNVVVVSADDVDPVDSSATVTVSIPSLEVVKTAAAPVVEAGGTVDFYISVTNTGDTALECVSMSDVWAITYEGKAYKPNETFAVIDKLEPGAQQMFKVTYAVPEGVTEGTVLTNTASAEASNGAKDQDSDDVTVYVPVAKAPDFTIRKTANASMAKPGETIVYSIIVTNTGNTDLTNIAVSDNLPVSYNGTTFAANAVITTIPVLAQGESTVINVSYLVPTSAVPGEFITNTASAKPAELAAKTADNNVQIIAPDNPAYSVVKIADKTSVHPGEKITYTIVVTNTGNCALKNFSIYDDLLDRTFQIGDLGVGQIWRTTGSDVVYTVPANAQDSASITNNVKGVSDAAPENRGTWVLSVYDEGKNYITPSTGDSSTGVHIALILMGVSAAFSAAYIIHIRTKSKKKITR